MSTAPARLPVSNHELLIDVVKTACKEAVQELLAIRELRPKRMLQVPAAAQYIGVSPREIYNMLENHGLPSVKHGSRRLIDIEDLDAWIKAHKE